MKKLMMIGATIVVGLFAFVILNADTPHRAADGGIWVDSGGTPVADGSVAGKYNGGTSYGDPINGYTRLVINCIYNPAKICYTISEGGKVITTTTRFSLEPGDEVINETFTSSPVSN